MNQLMRQTNENIAADPLWKGRFYVRQVSAQWYEYEDRSGAELFVVLEFIDRKTGITHTAADTVNNWRYPNGFFLWREMNDFIVEKVNVWSENPRPSI